MTVVGVLEARNNLSALIKRAKAGEKIIISSRDEPQVQLIPVAPEPMHGTGPAILKFLTEHPIPQGLGRSPEEIAAYIQDTRDSWQ